MKTKTSDSDKTYLNKTVLERVKECGCAYCQRVFNVERITNWTDSGQTAICPFCSIDAVLPTTERRVLAEEHRRRFLQEKL